MSWLGDRSGASELLDLRPSLATMVDNLRRDAQLDSPGRTAAIVTARVTQIIHGTGSMKHFGALSAAEQAVVAVTEQFLLDAHGVDDPLIGALGDHYSAAEQVAIMFHLALTDGFVKFNRVFGLPEQVANDHQRDHQRDHQHDHQHEEHD